MQSRRQFLARAGAAGAAVLAPQALLLVRRARAKPAPLLGPAKFAEGVASGDPGAARDHAVDPRRGAGAARAASGSRSRATRPSGTSWRATSIGTRPGAGRQRQGARDRAQALRAVLLPLRDQARLERAVGRFRTAPPPDSRQPLTFALLLLPGLHARLLQRPRRAWPSEDDLDFVVCLGDYIYAETYHTVAGGTASRRHDRPPGLPADVPLMADDARRTTATSTRSTARDTSLRKVHAKAPMIVDLGRPRGAGQLRRRARPAAACRPSSSTATAPRAPAYRAFVRVDADLRRQARPDLPLAALRQDDGAVPARPAPLPRRPAVRRRRSRPAAPSSTSRATSSAASRWAGSSASSRPPRPPGR